MLEQKIAIAELERNNRAKREAISQLNSKIGELEQRLNKLPEETATVESKGETAISEVAETPAEPKEETMEVLGPAPEEPEEESVTVAPLEDSMTAQEEEFNESFKRQHEKKKRKLF